MAQYKTPVLNKFLKRNDTQKRVDKGLLYLSLAMLVWIFSGCWSYTAYKFSFEHTNGYQLGIDIFSIVNNMFLLLALFYFYYAPQFIYNNKKNINTVLIAYYYNFNNYFFSVLFPWKKQHSQWD